MHKLTLLPFSQAPFTLVLLTLGLTACAVGPDYTAPEMDVPAHFTHADTHTVFSTETEQQFWHGFDDPLLASLITRVLTANNDLQGALARYEGAAALLTGARREHWPSLSVGASAAEHHLAAVERNGANSPERVELYQAGVAARWELDLAGRVRRATESRRAELDAAGADLGALQIALVGQLASRYFELRGLQQQYLIAEQTVTNQQDTLDIVSSRLAAGRGTQLDQRRAQTQLDLSRAALPDIDAGIRAAMHHIAVLTGAPPAALLEELAPAGALPDTLPVIPAGSPGDALRRRPDVRAAERRVAAASARIGVATADLFPRFTLDGLLGSVAGTPGDLFSGAAESRRIALGIDWTFLDAGRVRSRIDAADAEARAALADYRQTVLVVLQETETLLVRYQRSQTRTDALADATQAAEEAAQLAHTRFDQGFIGHFEVLAAEQELISTRNALIQSRTDTTVSMVNLYRALAGAPLESPVANEHLSANNMQAAP